MRWEAWRRLSSRRRSSGGFARQVEVVAELRSVAQRGKGTPERANMSAKEGQARLMLHELCGHSGFRVLASEPEQPPLHLQVVLAV
jgi:hypothetical protein